MRYSTQAKSISHLKAKAAQILRDLSERREPLIIKKHGEARAVIQDLASYEEPRRRWRSSRNSPRSPSEATFRDGALSPADNAIQRAVFRARTTLRSNRRAVQAENDQMGNVVTSGKTLCPLPPLARLVRGREGSLGKCSLQGPGHPAGPGQDADPNGLLLVRGEHPQAFLPSTGSSPAETG